MQGTVRRVADFGVFVELETHRGKWGLVHFSQIRDVPPGGDRIDVGAEMSVDDKIWVKVMSVDLEQQRIALRSQTRLPLRGYVPCDGVGGIVRAHLYVFYGLGPATRLYPD